MSYQGLDRWIANRIASTGRGSFLRILFLMFGVTALLSMWMSNTATTAMMLPLVLGILGRTATPETGSNGRNAPYLLGVAFAASIGGIGTLVGSPPNAIAVQKLGLGFGEWMRFGVPAVIVLLPLMVPIFYAVGSELGVGPVKLVIPLTIAASCTFMLPVATPPNAIVFGTGRVSQREMMRLGLLLNLTFIVALTLLARLMF